MDFRTFELEGPVEVTPKRFADERGYFSEIFRADRLSQHIGQRDFVQENQSLSIPVGTIRGIHFQVGPAVQGKLVRCVAGSIFDVAVDLRQGSATFGRWIAVVLSAETGNQLWIPEGFGHGFCSLEPRTIVCYRVTDYYSPDHDKGLAWDDPDLAIEWPGVADAGTLSAKDRVQPNLTELPAYFSMEDSRCV
jgi:dTDP-4-dehydrorhamnose 3,5-epimerase